MRIILFILAIAPIILFSQNVGINTDGSSPDPSAIFDVKSTTQGMLVPRLTSVQRDLIATPATGLLVFDTTLGAFHFYDGSGWLNLSEGAVLSDADGDTKIEVEQSPDDDIVIITAGGNEIVKIHSDRIDMNSYDDNTILGEDAAENISQANLSTIIGARAGRNYTGDYGVFVGVEAYKETQGQYNTAIGYQAASNDSFGYQNTFLGAEAGKNNKGYQSVIIGRGAGINNDASLGVSIGYNAGAVNEGFGNIFIGAKAGIASTGFDNLFIGENAGLQNTTGGGNIYIGRDAGKAGNNYSNVHVGSGSGEKSTGYSNVIMGANAALNTLNGHNSVIIGNAAAAYDTVSTNNVIIGSDAGSGGFNNTFKHMKKENVLIGERAGFSIQGNGNTAVGYRAGQSATGSSNVFLGREAGGSEPGNSKLYISNTSTSEPLIYGEFDNDLVRINDRLEVVNNSSLIAIDATVNGLNATAVKGTASYGSNGTTNYGGYFSANGYFGRGVYGIANWGGPHGNYGGYFQANGFTGKGVYGYAASSANSANVNFGGFFQADGGAGRGVFGKASHSTGANYGGYFTSQSTSGTGIYGNASSTTGTNYGGNFMAAGNTGFGVFSLASGSDGTGVYGLATGLDGTGVYASGSGGNGIGIFAQGGQRAAIFQGEVQTNGHLHINAPNNDARIYMKSDTGIEGRVLQRQSGTHDIHIGDIDSNGGEVYIRADGDDRLVVRQDGSVEIKDPTNPTLTFERTSSGAYDAQISTGSSSHIYFKNGNQLGSLENSMIIRNDGEVQIYHSGSNGQGLRLQNRVNNKYWSLYTDEGASGHLHLYSGSTYVGNFNAASGVYTATSDRRRKENIINLESIMDKVQNLQIKRYRFRNQSSSEPESIGLIAQDVNLLFPEFVAYDEDTDTYTMDYAGLSSIALKAIQEQSELIKNLQEQIDALKTK